MIQKFRMKRTDTGEEYWRTCDVELLAHRKIGEGPVVVGDVFQCESRLDGSKYTETLLRVGRPGMASTTRTWIMRSDSMGVNPDQINKQMAADAANGIHVDYDRETGQAIYRSPKQYKKHCEIYGFVTVSVRNGKGGGYSDPQSYSDEERQRRGLPMLAHGEDGQLLDDE